MTRLTVAEKEAAGMLELLSTFIARYEIAYYGGKDEGGTIATFKDLVREHCIGSRQHEAAIGQFLAQIDYIVEQEML